jgi:hypothetical protein
MNFFDKLCHPWIWLGSRLGHWTWEHDYKTCPIGNRHCAHMHWHWGKPK